MPFVKRIGGHLDIFMGNMNISNIASHLNFNQLNKIIQNETLIDDILNDQDEILTKTVIW